MPALSLLTLSTRTAAQNAKNLMDIGNIPYSLARPFLIKIDNPAQLRAVELNSPHIIPEDRELWIEFIKRDVPLWDRFELPKASDCWYDIYRDLMEQVRREVDEDAERLKRTIDQINSKRASSGSKLVTERQVARLPKPQPTTAQRYAAHDRKMGGITPKFSASIGPDGDRFWSLDTPRLRPERGRSDPKRNSIFSAKRNKALAVPTHRLGNGASQIKQVPRWLVDEHKQPPPQLSAAVSPPPRSSAPPTINLSSAASLQAREARLRALTSQRHSASAVDRPPSATLPRARAAVETRPGQSPQRLGVSSSLSPPPRSVSTGDQLLSSQPSTAASRPAPPALAVVRKRAAPSVFIQPKKRKV